MAYYFFGCCFLHTLTSILKYAILPQAPDYHEFISNPMDFSTMRQKLEDYEYLNFDMFEDDFNLMIQNCMSFNHEDTIYYRAAVRMRTQCKPILKGARKRIKQACIDPQTGIHAELPQSSTTDETSAADGMMNVLFSPDKFEAMNYSLQTLSLRNY